MSCHDVTVMPIIIARSHMPRMQRDGVLTARDIPFMDVIWPKRLRGVRVVSRGTAESILRSAGFLLKLCFSGCCIVLSCLATRQLVHSACGFVAESQLVHNACDFVAKWQLVHSACDFVAEWQLLHTASGFVA